MSFLKTFDTGRKVVVHKHEGHIQARIVYYLMNVHITPRYGSCAYFVDQQGFSTGLAGIKTEILS